MVKIYKHLGKGKFIGSCYIVIADSHASAVRQITEQMCEGGLVGKDGKLSEDLHITVYPIKPGLVIHTDNGDY